MPVLREQDFDKLAGRIVDEFLSGKGKLADLAAQEAQQQGMNPDQIERMVQAANTQTFLKLMDQQKSQGAGDLMQEFDPIDSRNVIKIIIDSKGVHVEQPHPEAGGQMPPMPPMGDEHELPDEMSQMRMGPQGGEDHPMAGMPGMVHGDPSMPQEGEQGHEEAESPEEEALEHAVDPEGEAEEHEEEGDEEPEEEEETEEGPAAAGGNPFAKKDKPKGKNPFGTKTDKKKKKAKKPPMSQAKKEATILRMRKLAGIMEDERLQAENLFEEEFAKLAAQFKKVYGPNYAAFEKDAMAAYMDETGFACLNLLRSTLRLPGLEKAAAFEKSAALNDRHVSEETPELKSFELLHKLAAHATRLEEGVTWIKSRCAI